MRDGHGDELYACLSIWIEEWPCPQQNNVLVGHDSDLI